MAKKKSTNKKVAKKPAARKKPDPEPTTSQGFGHLHIPKDVRIRDSASVDSEIYEIIEWPDDEFEDWE